MSARGGADRADRDPVRARPWPGPAPPARVLAIRLHALGDTVLTLPWLDALRHTVPGTAIDFLTREEVAGIPRSVVLFERVHGVGGGRDPRRILLGALRLVPRLRARRYDVVIDLQRSRVTRLVRRLLRPRAWSEFDRLSHRPAWERTREAIEAAVPGSLRVRPGLELREPAAGLETLRGAGWNGADPLVVLNPAGGFPARRWPLDAYAEFARLWVEREPATRFLVLGLPALRPRAVELRGRLGDRLLDLTGRTTAAEAFALLHRARLVVSDDSGLVHMAAAAGVPTVALFGGSRAAWSAPYGLRSAWIRACAQADGACLDGRCRAGSPTCLEGLRPEAVLRAAPDVSPP